MLLNFTLQRNAFTRCKDWWWLMYFSILPIRENYRRDQERKTASHKQCDRRPNKQKMNEQISTSEGNRTPIWKLGISHSIHWTTKANPPDWAPQRYSIFNKYPNCLTMDFTFYPCGQSAGCTISIIIWMLWHYQQHSGIRHLTLFNIRNNLCNPLFK